MADDPRAARRKAIAAALAEANAKTGLLGPAAVAEIIGPDGRAVAGDASGTADLAKWLRANAPPGPLGRRMVEAAGEMEWLREVVTGYLRETQVTPDPFASKADPTLMVAKRDEEILRLRGCSCGWPARLNCEYCGKPYAEGAMTEETANPFAAVMADHERQADAQVAAALNRAGIPPRSETTTAIARFLRALARSADAWTVLALAKSVERSDDRR